LTLANTAKLLSTSLFIHFFLLVCNISLQGLAETWDSVHPGN